MIDFEDLESIVGSFCTLLYPHKGQIEGTIVEYMGNEQLIQLINGKEVVEYRDDVVIYELVKKESVGLARFADSFPFSTVCCTFNFILRKMQFLFH